MGLALDARRLERLDAVAKGRRSLMADGLGTGWMSSSSNQNTQYEQCEKEAFASSVSWRDPRQMALLSRVATASDCRKGLKYLSLVHLCSCATGRGRDKTTIHPLEALISDPAPGCGPGPKRSAPKAN